MGKNVSFDPLPKTAVTIERVKIAVLRLLNIFRGHKTLLNVAEYSEILATKLRTKSLECLVNLGTKSVNSHRTNRNLYSRFVLVISASSEVVNRQNCF